MSDDGTPRARSATEMRFAASLIPCRHCHTTEPAQLDLVGSGTSWSLTGKCSRCAAPRSYAWQTEGNPNKAAVLPRQLGDARPSQIIRPGQFIAELDRVLPLVRPAPEALPPIEWRASLAKLDRGLTCLYELLKFVPDGAEGIPDGALADDERRDRAARGERFERAWLQAELDRLLALRARYEADAPRIWQLEKPAAPRPVVGAIDRESLTAHQQWVRAGRRGPGRLEVEGYSAKGLRLAGVTFEGARLAGVSFDGALLDAARMIDAELRDVSAREAICTSVNFSGATIAGGTFERAGLALAVFVDTTIDETGFDGANLDRTEWKGAQVTAAGFDNTVFGNAWLDGGRFAGCTFRKADFRALKDGMRTTTAGAVFEDCDLRWTRWDGRDLSGATFVRCKLHGITGTPAAVTNVTIVDPDLSVDGDGSDIADAGDVLALWQRAQ